MNIEQLAEQAYQAYGAVTDFKNYQGLPMPKWAELPPKIREAWCAATKATRRSTLLDDAISKLLEGPG